MHCPIGCCCFCSAVQCNKPSFRANHFLFEPHAGLVTASPLLRSRYRPTPSWRVAELARLCFSRTALAFVHFTHTGSELWRDAARFRVRPGCWRRQVSLLVAFSILCKRYFSRPPSHLLVFFILRSCVAIAFSLAAPCHMHRLLTSSSENGVLATKVLEYSLPESECSAQ